MKKIDRIIKESIDSVINENSFKNIPNRIKAAAHIAAKKEGGKSASERYMDWLAKQIAIQDINKELRGERVNPNHKSYSKTWSDENGGYNPDYDRSMKLQQYMDADDEFSAPVSNKIFKDSKEWLINRNQ